MMVRDAEGRDKNSDGGGEHRHVEIEFQLDHSCFEVTVANVDRHHARRKVRKAVLIACNDVGFQCLNRSAACRHQRNTERSTEEV